MIAYQPDVDIQQEIRKVGDWEIHLPLPADVIANPECADDASGWLARRGWTVHHHTEEAATEQTLDERFRELAQQWEDETGHLSSPSQRMLHPSYKAILGMGHEHKNAVIDLLLKDMKDNRRQWFWALSYLAQSNPIKPEDAGRIDKMINAWVRWGETRVRR